MVPTLEAWKAAGKTLAIFSSGSVQAQLQFFSYVKDGSETRDIKPLFSAHYDTVNAGPKMNKASYDKICSELGKPPSKVVFLTDNVKGMLAFSTCPETTHYPPSLPIAHTHCNTPPHPFHCPIRRSIITPLRTDPDYKYPHVYLHVWYMLRHATYKCPSMSHCHFICPHGLQKKSPHIPYPSRDPPPTCIAVACFSFIPQVTTGYGTNTFLLQQRLKRQSRPTSTLLLSTVRVMRRCLMRQRRGSQSLSD